MRTFEDDLLNIFRKVQERWDFLLHKTPDDTTWAVVAESMRKSQNFHAGVEVTVTVGMDNHGKLYIKSTRASEGMWHNGSLFENVRNPTRGLRTLTDFPALAFCGSCGKVTMQTVVGSRDNPVPPVELKCRGCASINYYDKGRLINTLKVW